MLKAPLCMAGCSELLLCRMLYAPVIPMQDASSSFFAGCLVAPHVSKLTGHDVTLVEVVWVLPSGR